MNDNNYLDLITSTVRQDVHDDTKGGQFLTKKGKPRKRVKNFSSQVIPEDCLHIHTDKK